MNLLCSIWAIKAFFSIAVIRRVPLSRRPEVVALMVKMFALSSGGAASALAPTADVLPEGEDLLSVRVLWRNLLACDDRREQGASGEFSSDMVRWLPAEEEDPLLEEEEDDDLFLEEEEDDDPLLEEEEDDGPSINDEEEPVPLEEEEREEEEEEEEEPVPEEEEEPVPDEEEEDPSPEVEERFLLDEDEEEEEEDWLDIDASEGFGFWYA
jgi:outer membrane biosynthesis protein TonB